MANKYHVTKLDPIKLETESQVYETTVEVDSLDYISLQFGESFSLRFNYNQAEKLEEQLKTARYIIQDQAHANTGKPVTERPRDDSDAWEPNDPANW
jgi:ribonucleotide reductase beta subunit family protein with ferritin-like domain